MTAKQFNQFLKRHDWTGYQFHKRSGLPKATIYQWAEKGVSRHADNLLIRYIDKYPTALTKLTRTVSNV